MIQYGQVAQSCTCYGGRTRDGKGNREVKIYIFEGDEDVAEVFLGDAYLDDNPLSAHPLALANIGSGVSAHRTGPPRSDRR